MPPTVALRPRSFAELFDAAFLLTREHVGPLATLSAMIAIPSIALSAANVTLFGPAPTAPDLGAEPAAAARMVVLSLVAMCWYFVGIAALVHAASNAYLGEPVEPVASLRRALGRAGAVIGAHVLAYLLAMAVLSAALVAVILCVAAVAAAAGAAGMTGRPGVVLSGVLAAAGAVLVFGVAGAVLARYVNVTAVVMLEGAGAAGAMRRSRALAAGHLRRIVGLFAVAFALSAAFAVAALSVGALVGNAYVANLVAALLWVPLYPLVASVLAALYYDLRIRKEGFDIAHAADSLGAAEAASAPAA